MAARVFLNRLSLSLPEMGFTDMTVHCLKTAPMAVDSTCALMVSRAVTTPAASLSTIVADYEENRAPKLDAYQCLDERVAAVDGHEAVVLSSRFRAGGSMAYQRHLHVIPDGLWLHLWVSGPMDARARCDALFAAVVETLRFR